MYTLVSYFGNVDVLTMQDAAAVLAMLGPAIKSVTWTDGAHVYTVPAFAWPESTDDLI